MHTHTCAPSNAHAQSPPPPRRRRPHWIPKPSLWGCGLAPHTQKEDEAVSSSGPTRRDPSLLVPAAALHPETWPRTEGRSMASS